MIGPLEYLSKQPMDIDSLWVNGVPVYSVPFSLNWNYCGTGVLNTINVDSGNAAASAKVHENHMPPFFRNTENRIGCQITFV